jgi:hypothetical protein
LKGIPTGRAGAPEGGGHEQDQPLEVDGSPLLRLGVRSLTGALDDNKRTELWKVHNGKNNGTVPIRLTAFLVAEKGKPLSAPAK